MGTQLDPATALAPTENDYLLRPNPEDPRLTERVSGVDQTGDTLHLSDSFSRVWGAHTIKFGGQYQFAQVRLEPNATFNGTFTFAGT